MRRRIKSADVQFVSLCPKGKTRLPVLYKSDGAVELDTLTKDMNDQGELLAVVYAPEVRDADGDVASSDVIRKMMHSFAKNGNRIDLRHDGKTLTRDQAFVAENFEIQKSDSRFKDWKNYDGQPVDVSGGWGLLVKIDDPALRTRYRNGEWNGVSLFGTYAHDGVELEKGTTGNEESTVKIEEVQKLLDERDSRLLKSLGDLITKAPPPVAAPADLIPAPAKLSFDPLNKEQVQAHLEKIERETLAKSVDWTNPEAVRAYLAKSAAPVTTPAPANGETEKLQKEIQVLTDRLGKLTKSTTVPPTTEAPALEKGNAPDPVAAGKSVADVANRMRGFSR